ncbi:Transcription factor spt20 [Tulasnella sp. 418]|nr:Transcription factor spt20 [Tulasnella sp. 418]
MSLYNPERLHEQILSHHADSPPSFTIHFYQEHWLINNSRPNLYHTPISFLLDDIRERRIPTDWLQLLDQHGVTFYEGCLIIELVDHRVPSGSTPTRERVLLVPSAETLWADIVLQYERSGKVLSDDIALDFEARYLAATAGPLCLDPDPLVTRIANTAMRSSALRPPAAFRAKDEDEENSRGDAAKARHVKLMSLMHPHPMPSSRLYEFIMRRNATGPVSFQSQEANPAASQATVPVATATSNPPIAASQGSEIKKAKKKSEPSETPQPPEPLELDHATGGKAKRKASTSVGLPPSSQPAKKKTMKKASESAEPSPAPVAQPLPPPQPVAYQLAPSTVVPIPQQKKQQAAKKAAVKKEPSAQPVSYPSPATQPTPIPLPPNQNQNGGLMLNHIPMQQVPVVPQQPNAARPKSETPTPTAPTPLQQHPVQQFPHSAALLAQAQVAQFQRQQQLQQQQQQQQQNQSQPHAAPSPSPAQAAPIPNPGIPLQFQQAAIQHQQQNALNLNMQQLNRPGGVMRVNPHGQLTNAPLQHMAMGMALPSQAQSPFQQPTHVPSPQPQHRSSPLPAHSRVPSRPPSSQQVNTPPQQQPLFAQAQAQALHQRQQSAQPQPAQPQQGMNLGPTPNFPLQLHGIPAAGWRLPRHYPLPQQQLNQLAQNGTIAHGMSGLGRGQPMGGQGR